MVYALTFIPAVERFLSSDRLRLLNAVELACFGTLIWQAVKFALCKMRKTDWPRNRAIAACIAAANDEEGVEQDNADNRLFIGGLLYRSAANHQRRDRKLSDFSGADLSLHCRTLFLQHCADENPARAEYA